MMAMKIKLSTIASLVALTAVILFSTPTYAHVLIRDDANSTSAILHITPEDNPIAGEESKIYFSLSNQSLQGSMVGITITNQDTGKSDTVQTRASSTSVSTEYTFTTRGVYDIKLKIGGKKAYSFSHTQRVSRGIGKDTAKTPDYPLASALLILSVAGLLLIVAIFVNRRRAINAQSHF